MHDQCASDNAVLKPHCQTGPSGHTKITSMCNMEQHARGRPPEHPTQQHPSPKQVLPWMTVHVLPGHTLQHLIAQQAINVSTICEMATADTIFTPRSLLPHAKPSHSPHFEHYASPIIHPVTGKTISSYKQLMNNPATAEVW
jgi:hypothetical protein